MELNQFAHVILLIVFVAYMVANAIFAARKFKNRQESAYTSEIRIKRNKTILTKGLIRTGAVILIVLLSDISFSDIGFRAANLPYNLWFTVITLVLCGALFVYNLVEIIRSLVSDKYRQATNEKLSKQSWGAGMTLPRNKKERILFTGVSVTAGFSEEILCRGFLFYLLFAVFPNVSPAIIIIATSALFGFCHLYQGIQGVMQTALGGALLGCLYLATGSSLVYVIILHFFTDYVNVFALPDDCSQ
jgi:membrane protease YdiL (CAAX protease family)